MDKKQTLDHFRTLTSQELEQVVDGGWLEDLLKHFKSMGIETTYEVNPGNHFQDVNLRCAKGILELLQ